MSDSAPRCGPHRPDGCRARAPELLRRGRAAPSSTRTLEATGALTSVDAGLIRLPGPGGGDPLFATLGMTTDEAARQPVAGPPGGQPARAVRIGYTYTHEEIRDESDLIRGGVSIPLRDSKGEPIGTLASSGAARSARRPTQSWPR